jgi:ketosteroid isomerase-like protein
MQSQDENAAAQAIAALIAEFCRRVDSGEGARVAELFTTDAAVNTPHFNLAGRDAIHAWFAERAQPGKRLSRHFWTNLQVTNEGDGRYVAHAYAMTLASTPPAPGQGATIAVGTSTDWIVFEDDRPLFSRRTLDIAFEGRIVAPETVV